jgi:hypothetical protein
MGITLTPAHVFVVPTPPPGRRASQSTVFLGPLSPVAIPEKKETESYCPSEQNAQ